MTVTAPGKSSQTDAEHKDSVKKNPHDRGECSRGLPVQSPSGSPRGKLVTDLCF